jgi:glycosyltransferase involved in cell wall biosynthesis
VQRCGDEIAGGAESLCLQTARHMSVEWDVEIITTCARDARTWEDAYPAGATTIGGVAARRFSVPVPRDGAAFDRASRIVARGGAGPDEERAWLRAQGPYSPDLLAYLEREGARFDRIFFYSYLYATTAFGLPLVAERSVLVPLAHDEWMLQIPAYEPVFASAAAIAYSSEEERALVLRTFPGVRDTPECICGVGIDPPAVSPDDFRRTYAPEGDLFVCVGRVEEAKGTAELLAYFEALQAADPASRTLVLVGPVAMAIPKRPDVIALGQRSDGEKWDALAAATIVCVPSAYESLSLVSLEAWAVGTPILANGASAVLIGQCRRANGGLWYANEGEFVELARTRLLGRAADLGASGRRYVRERYTWDAVREALRGLLVDGANAVTDVASIADIDSDASPPSP